jgi:hypothetical protein
VNRLRILLGALHGSPHTSAVLQTHSCLLPASSSCQLGDSVIVLSKGKNYRRWFFVFHNTYEIRLMIVSCFVAWGILFS